jgi:hypothetical protein
VPLAIIYCYYCRFLHIQPHCVSQAIDEDDVDALFDSNQVRPEARSGRGIRNLNPAAERLELAAAVLWFHTHANERVPAHVRLSGSGRSSKSAWKRAAPAALAQASGSGPRGSKFSVSLI